MAILCDLFGLIKRPLQRFLVTSNQGIKKSRIESPGRDFFGRNTSTSCGTKILGICWTSPKRLWCKKTDSFVYNGNPGIQCQSSSVQNTRYLLTAILTMGLCRPVILGCWPSSNIWKLDVFVCFVRVFFTNSTTGFIPMKNHDLGFGEYMFVSIATTKTSKSK